MTIAEVEGWDTKSFEKAYKLSLADNGNFVWHTEPKINKGRSLKARIRISLGKDGRIPIVAEFFDKESSFQFEVLIIDTFLHFVNWERAFEKPTWLDNERFGYSFLNSQLLIFANSTSRQSETIISENTWKQEEIEGRLKQLTYRHFSNDK